MLKTCGNKPHYCFTDEQWQEVIKLSEECGSKIEPFLDKVSIDTTTYSLDLTSLAVTIACDDIKGQTINGKVGSVSLEGEHPTNIIFIRHGFNWKMRMPDF